MALGFMTAAAGAETLDDAWRAALASDGRLAAAEARTSAADSSLAEARAERYPTVTASANSSRWRDSPAFDFGPETPLSALPLFGGDTMNMANAQISLPLYAGGALSANVAAAAATRDGQQRRADALRQDVKLAVAEAYIGVLLAQSAFGVARSNTTSLAAHTRDVEDMRRTGQVPTNDYLAAAVSLADATQRELAAQSALQIANALYNRRVGRPLDTPVTLEALDEALTANVTEASLATLLAQAQATRPELAELADAADALAARATAARAERRPRLAVDGGYAYLENEFLNRQDYWFVTFGVQMRLFDSGRSRHATASFERQSAALLAERTDLAAAVELDVRRAYEQLTTARSRLDVAARAVEQAAENLRVVRDRYRNGEGTNSEVLDAESLRILSISNSDTARYDVRFAELRLARAVGAL